mmetsp:Transcript_2552/g.9087  ORF Transcript_2552/g.9087 Transcript_2552/m.9087 type:complete len:201 (+) Transcript_2552:236-838(+)
MIGARVPSCLMWSSSISGRRDVLPVTTHTSTEIGLSLPLYPSVMRCWIMCVRATIISGLLMSSRERPGVSMNSTSTVSTASSGMPCSTSSSLGPLVSVTTLLSSPLVTELPPTPSLQRSSGRMYLPLLSFTMVDFPTPAPPSSVITTRLASSTSSSVKRTLLAMWSTHVRRLSRTSCVAKSRCMSCSSLESDWTYVRTAA